MPTRSASAEWRGDLKRGDGTVRLGSGLFEGPYSYPSRFENGQGTNPEELIGAAHAGCFSMAFANLLAQAGHEPERVRTEARVHLENGAIVGVDLHTTVRAEGLEEETMREIADRAKENCPVSKALAALEIRVEAKLG